MPLHRQEKKKIGFHHFAMQIPRHTYGLLPIAMMKGPNFHIEAATVSCSVQNQAQTFFFSLWKISVLEVRAPKAWSRILAFLFCAQALTVCAILPDSVQERKERETNRRTERGRPKTPSLRQRDSQREKGRAWAGRNKQRNVKRENKINRER